MTLTNQKREIRITINSRFLWAVKRISTQKAGSERRSDGERSLPEALVEPALEPLHEDAAFCQR